MSSFLVPDFGGLAVINKIALFVLAAALLGSASVALADDDHHHWGSTDIRTGFGEEIYVNHGLFGTHETVMKDRLGDQYVKKHGLLGTKDEGVSIFGNGYEKHKGLIGGTQAEAHDILGDRVISKKTFLGLGPRKTQVDLSGMGSVVQQVAGKVFTRTQMPGGFPMGAPDLGSVGMGVPGMGAAGMGAEGKGFQPFAAAPDNNLDAAAGLNDAAHAPPMQPMPRPYGP
jgi:hypothetical protein